MKQPHGTRVWGKILKISMPANWEATRQALMQRMALPIGPPPPVPKWGGDSPSRALMGPILTGEGYILTAVGQQLFALRPCLAEDAYVEAFAEAVREAGFDAEVIPVPIEEVLR